MQKLEYKRILSQLIFLVFRNFILLLLLLLLCNFQLAHADSDNVPSINKEVEVAVLAEDWKKVANLLDTVTPETPSPVLRMIKGHADLALNRNNESLCLFLSVSSADDLNKWEVWTTNFAEKKTTSAIAYYFMGDSLARFEKRDESLSSFNKALALNPKHAMVLNARGVVYATNGELSLARNDFDGAIVISKSLADAHANLGARFIQISDGAEGAIKSFDNALKISPNFALALHGKGCVEFIINNDNYERDIARSMEYGTFVEQIFADNILSIEAYMIGMEKEDMLASLQNENPGAPVGVRYDKAVSSFNNYVNNPSQRNWNKFSNSTKGLSTAQMNSLWDNQMSPVFNNNPTLKSHAERSNSKVFTHNNSALPKIASTSAGAAIHAAGLTGAAAATAATEMPQVGYAVGTAAYAAKKVITSGIDSQTSHNAGYSNFLISKFQSNTTQMGSMASSVRVKDNFSTRPAYNLTQGSTSSFKNPGGVKAAWSTQDYGDWPFDALYGLLYKMKSKENLSSGGEK